MHILYVVSRFNAHIQLIAPCAFIRRVLTFIAWLIELNAPAQLDVHVVVEQAIDVPARINAHMRV